MQNQRLVLSLHPALAMRSLPAAIEYKKRVKSKFNQDAMVITHSHLLEDFLLPYQPEFNCSHWIPAKDNEEIIRIPSKGYDKLLGTDSKSFFEKIGFPSSPRGDFLSKLHKHRRNLQGLYYYYVIYDRHSEYNADIPLECWKSILAWFKQEPIPAMSHRRFILDSLVSEAAVNTLVHISREKEFIWEIASDLLLAKMYIGGCNIISELAMLLDVPCVILTTQDEEFPLETKWNVQYVQRGTAGLFYPEDFFDAILTMERLLLPEH